MKFFVEIVPDDPLKNVGKSDWCRLLRTILTMSKVGWVNGSFLGPKSTFSNFFLNVFIRFF